MEGKRNLCADDLIYILQGMVDVQFRAKHYKATNCLGAHRLSDYERRRKAKADDIGPELAKTLIDTTEAADSTTLIESFENRPNVEPYAVNNNANVWLNNCRCSGYILKIFDGVP
ncbi:hypothetical protein BGZ54_004490 [Gamsiella multidivaricata]|nr:hypothetical protein BGZ54_004490 [Gamsiella multidivaricata]